MHPFPLLIEICVTGATEKISGPRFNLFAGALSQAEKGKVSANQRWKSAHAFTNKYLLQEV